MQIVQHEADVVVDVPVQRGGVDGLPSTRDAGRGRELMLVPGWWYVISAESFLDRMTEMPDVLELAPTIHCPTLFIRGDEESPETYPAERFKERAGGPCDVEIVPNCNHFYVGREEAICELISGWLVRTLNIGARESY